MVSGPWKTGFLLALASCSAARQNQVCIGVTTTPTERCTLFEDVSDGVACSASAYALEKMDEQLAKDANAGAAARTTQSFAPVDAGPPDAGAAIPASPSG
jgi:hypothetical protein